MCIVFSNLLSSVILDSIVRKVEWLVCNSALLGVLEKVEEVDTLGLGLVRTYHLGL